MLNRKVLNTLEIGFKCENFRILIMLPSTVKEIMKELNLTKVPVNVRLNKLQELGLVKRSKGTGIVEGTRMTKQFIKIYYSM